MHSQVLRQITEVGGVETERIITTYSNESGHVLPKEVTSYPDGFNTGESIATTFTYDNQGNVIYQKTGNDLSVSYLWGYNGEYPIANVINANQNEFFYTGFEEDVQSVDNTIARSGKQSYIGVYQVILPSPGTFRLTYWLKEGSTDWVFRSRIISENTLIGGTTDHVDDVRVYPADAFMTSFTYDPLIGQTSVADPSGMIRFLEYDGLGRLKLIRDHQGRIEQSFLYRFQQ
jgi:YD repeat-containing protein